MSAGTVKVSRFVEKVENKKLPQHPTAFSSIIYCYSGSPPPIDDEHSQGLQIVPFALRKDSEADAPAADVSAFDR
ncbi:MAG: hypothetical protein Q6L60_01845 [Thermostichus sp. HHBFW_bins_43]